MDERLVDYLEYLRAVRGLSLKTIENYRRDLLHFELFLDGKDIDQAEANDIRAFAGTLVIKKKAANVYQ